MGRSAKSCKRPTKSQKQTSKSLKSSSVNPNVEIVRYEAPKKSTREAEDMAKDKKRIVKKAEAMRQKVAQFNKKESTKEKHEAGHGDYSRDYVDLMFGKRSKA